MTKKQKREQDLKGRVQWAIKPTNRVKSSRKGFDKAQRGRDKALLKSFY